MNNNSLQNKTELFYYLLSKTRVKTNIKKQVRNEGLNLFPLSFSQEEFYFLNQLQPNDLALNLSFAYKLSGQLDINALEKTFTEIVRRHEVLRTVFIENDEGIFQKILLFSNFKLPVIDIEFKNTENHIAYAQEILSDLSLEPYDFVKGPLFRVQLIKISNEKYILWWGMHHIICDAGGQIILMKEIKELYSWFAFGERHKLPKLERQIADFAVWQRENYETNGLKEKILDWTAKLSGYDKNITLPPKSERPTMQTFNGLSEEFYIDKEIKKKLKELSAVNNTTLFTVLLSALKILIFKFTNKIDIVIGSPFSIRNYDFLENLICDLSNMLLYRTIINKDDTVCTVIKKVKDTILETLKYNDVPSQHVYYSMNRKREPAYSPLFQIMFIFHQIYTRDNDQFLDGVISKYLHIPIKSSQFDISLFLFDDDDIGLYGRFDYNTALYTREMICEFIECFKEILKIIAENPGLKICELSEEINKLVGMERICNNG